MTCFAVLWTTGALNDTFSMFSFHLQTAQTILVTLQLVNDLRQSTNGCRNASDIFRRRFRCRRRLPFYLSSLSRSRGTRERILISFRRREKSKPFLKTANWPPLWVFSGALGLVFVYIDSSLLGPLRMHNHDFLFAFVHTTHFSIITLYTLQNALPNVWLILFIHSIR